MWQHLKADYNQNLSASHARSSPIAGRTRSKSPTKPTPSQDTLSSSVLQGRFQQQPFFDGSSGTNPSSPNTSLPQQPNQLEKRARSLNQVTRSKRPQSSRKYRQSKLATSSSHVSTASQQSSAMAGHSTTPLISTSMLPPPAPEQLSRDAPPSSTTLKSTFSQSSTKHTQSKLTADSFYQQPNVAQRSLSVPGHSFARPSNRNSTSSGLPPSTASSQLINRESSVEPIVSRTRSQLPKKYAQQKLTFNDLSKRGRSQRPSSAAGCSHADQLSDREPTRSLRSQAMDAAPAINSSSSIAADKNSLSNKDVWAHLMPRVPGKSTSSLTEITQSKSRGPPKILPRSSRKTILRMHLK